MKKTYTVQVNDYMTPVRVELTDSEASAVAYVLEEISKSDKDALVQIEEEDTGDILFDNYDEWIKTHEQIEGLF